MILKHCDECGSLLATLEELDEGLCERCIFARDWALAEAKREYRVLLDAVYAQWEAEDRARLGKAKGA